MKTSYGLLVASLLTLGACTPATSVPDTSGGSAASAGPGYCESPPTDMTQMNRWNELCMPDR